MKLAVLASGGLGSTLLKFMFEKYEISCVLTDSSSQAIINFSTENNIPLFKGNPRKGNVSAFIAGYSIDVLVSVNYLFLIESDVINWPKKMAFNIHGSLLPKYRGRTPHVWSIINNEKETGITAHLIDEGCDTGAIIDQITIPIQPNDTGTEILQKYAAQYPKLIDSVLGKVQSSEYNTKVQDESKATYFGKRTPEDGEINWDWHKERIRNWVRAQSNPYPGAFSFMKGQKVIIDWVEYSDLGFDSAISNGTILTKKPIIVKTPNGAMELVSIRNHSYDFEIGDQFDN